MYAHSSFYRAGVAADCARILSQVFDADHNGRLNAEEPCIGTTFPGPSFKYMDREVYNAGVEYLQLESIHSSFDPWAKVRVCACTN
jgi:hypothetical protein